MRPFTFLVALLFTASCREEIHLAPELVDTQNQVITPPEGFHPFYKKYINANGIPIVGSNNVQDEAFVRARETVIAMTAKRPDVLAQMVVHRTRLGIIADEEVTTDLPEYADRPDPEAFSERGRGYGGTLYDPFTSCAEENVMRDAVNDRWYGQDILVHEFAHSIHLIGLVTAEPGFQDRLDKAYENAMAKGLWKGQYASTNDREYFAVSTQAWFQMSHNIPDDGFVDTRAELKAYDPTMYDLLKDVYYDSDWKPLPFFCDFHFTDDSVLQFSDCPDQ
jgi:hypothetical protein